MNGIYAIPIFSVVVMGMLNKRVPSVAAFYSMVIGLVVMVGLLIVYPALNGGANTSDLTGISNFHTMGIVFATLMLIMFIGSKVAPREEAWEITTNTPIDMTPWKGTKVASIILVIAVVTIYAAFSK